MRCVFSLVPLGVLAVGARGQFSNFTPDPTSPAVIAHGATRRRRR